MASQGRRSFLKLAGASAAAVAAVKCGGEDPQGETLIDEVERQEYEYIVVGSGAGGGPLAANLARSGHRVLLLEAGKDDGNLANYQVPAFHPLSTEDPAMRWDYFVKHYADAAQQRRDSKLTSQGVLYPRAGTLGGCTAHNAMITVYPHASDWDHIAQLTGDTSWSATQMRRYFELLERCEYLQGADLRGHGTRGWLRTRLADASLATQDAKLLKIITATALAFDLAGLVDGDPVFLRSQLLQLLKKDLNNIDPRRDTTEGLYMIPSAIAGARRNGPREYILATIAERAPLTLVTHALATKVLFDGRDSARRLKAVGVEYYVGERLYRATPGSPAAPTMIRKTVRATREVILACGAFNTPQLLKLSGVGPRAELERLGITVQVDLPGVGTNLQDRYEVGVVGELASDLSVLNGCTFGASGDPCLAEWRAGRGVYTSNGVVTAVVKRSVNSRPDPDLVVFGVPGDFRGYVPGYSRRAVASQRRFTWAVLKAHTGNRGGTVTLRTKNPRDTPEINFRYFHEGTTAGAAHTEDLRSVVEGVKFARSIGRHANNLMLFGSYREVWPGPNVSNDAQIGDFVRNEAWGHHASCTCPMGPDGDPNAVLDSRFKVRGTTGLRVVDASVFPRIPGFFIVVPIYMAAEKATDVLLEDIRETRRV